MKYDITIRIDGYEYISREFETYEGIEDITTKYRKEIKTLATIQMPCRDGSTVILNEDAKKRSVIIFNYKGD